MTPFPLSFQTFGRKLSIVRKGERNYRVINVDKKVRDIQVDRVILPLLNIMKAPAGLGKGICYVMLGL